MADNHAAAGLGALFGALCMVVADWGRRLLTRRDRTLEDAYRLAREIRADHERLRQDLEDTRRERHELWEEMNRRVTELEAQVIRRDARIAELEAAAANMEAEIRVLRAENARLLGMACVRALCDRRVQVEEQNNE